jgi:hypothetical protein
MLFRPQWSRLPNRLERVKKTLRREPCQGVPL